MWLINQPLHPYSTVRGVGRQNQLSSKLPIFVPLPFDYFVSNPSTTACAKCSSTISAQWSQTIA